MGNVGWLKWVVMTLATVGSWGQAGRLGCCLLVLGALLVILGWAN